MKLRNTVLILLIASFSAGHLLGSVTNHTTENLITGGFISESDQTNQSSLEPEYGTKWFLKPLDNNRSISYGLKPNASGWADSFGTRPYYVRTNGKGFRDKKFQRDKPNNTVRILVVGDSFTFGSGVNQSETYVEVLEEQLQNDFPKKKVQIVNTGVPGYGMKDYYLFLKNEGLHYNPDIVVVGLFKNDWFSTTEAYEFGNKANKIVEEEKEPDWTDKKINRFKKNTYSDLINRKLERNKIENTSFRFIENIDNLTQKNGIETIYYSVDRMKPKLKRFLTKWSAKSNSSVYYTRDYIQENKKIMRVSKFNHHPNAEGHRMIAKGLYKIVKERLNSSEALSPE